MDVSRQLRFTFSETNSFCPSKISFLPLILFSCSFQELTSYTWFFPVPQLLQSSLQVYQLYIQSVYQIFVFFFTFITNHYHFSLFLDLNDCLFLTSMLVPSLYSADKGSLKNSNLFIWLVGETRMLTKPSNCSLTFISLLELGRLWDWFWPIDCGQKWHVSFRQKKRETRV